jgi:hypothetical protein
MLSRVPFPQIQQQFKGKISMDQTSIVAQLKTLCQTKQNYRPLSRMPLERGKVQNTIPAPAAFPLVCKCFFDPCLVLCNKMFSIIINANCGIIKYETSRMDGQL